MLQGVGSLGAEASTGPSTSTMSQALGAEASTGPSTSTMLQALGAKASTGPSTSTEETEVMGRHLVRGGGGGGGGDEGELCVGRGRGEGVCIECVLERRNSQQGSKSGLIRWFMMLIDVGYV